MKVPRSRSPLFGATDSGQPASGAGRELTNPAEDGLHAQAEEIGSAQEFKAAPSHEQTQEPRCDGPSRSDANLAIATVPAGPADWETGWQKRASLVAVCAVGLLVFWIWAKIANAPSEPIQASDPPQIAIGSRVEIKQGFFGCPKQSDLKQVEVLAFARHDATAASLYRQSHGCPVFNKGEVVEVSDQASVNELLCLRWHGNPDCFWFPEQFVQQPRSKPPATSGTSDF